MSLFRNNAKPKQQPKIRIERVDRPKVNSINPKPPGTSAPPAILATRQKAIPRPPRPTTAPRKSPLPSPSPRSSPHPTIEPASSRASSVAISTPASISTGSILGGSRPRISSPLTSSDETGQRKRKAGSTHARSPDRVAFDSSSESEDDDDWLAAIDPNRHKKRARLAVEDDPDRVVLEVTAFEEAAKQKGKGLVHAVDLSSIEAGCTTAFKGKSADDILVTVQYPSMYPREQFELVWGKDKIDAVSSIISVVQHVADNYLTDTQARSLTDEHNGIIRRLTKASNAKVQDLALFKSALAEYNKYIRGLVKDGTIRETLKSKHGLPSHFVSFILEQVYDRTVAPKVELLSKYENGTDNVYGELLAPFVTNILVDKVHMKSSQVFVDLGSGVGNVVIQAALEIGCESWGCEMMENACNLGDAQIKEFKGRCKMWGLSTGKARLERGDFRKNARILEALKRADVVLVNNKAFTAQLNDDLVRMFLDLKAGCRIISLRSFVNDHKSNHNCNDVGSTILDVEEFQYPEGYVSWTNAGGNYFISTRK